jgi:hypothetical protein
MRRTILVGTLLCAATAACDLPTDASSGDGGGNGGGGGAAEIRLSARETSVTMKQAEQRTIIFDATPVGDVRGPIQVSVEGAPGTMITQILPDGRLLGITTARFGISTQAPQPGNYKVRLRASAPGARDAVTEIDVTVVSPRVYRGGFTIGNFQTSKRFPSGDRCVWDVSMSGSVTATYPDINSSAPGVVLRIQGTRWVSAVQQRVGNTICGSGSDAFEGTATGLSNYPGVGARVVVPTAGGSADEFYVEGAVKLIDGAGGVQVPSIADTYVRARYTCATCQGESEKVPAPLLVQ